MIYHLLYPYHDQIGLFNVFRYVTFRTAMASLTSLVIAFLLGPWLIRTLRKLQIGQSIREDGPQTHHSKQGTPTMGGGSCSCFPLQFPRFSGLVGTGPWFGIVWD